MLSRIPLAASCFCLVFSNLPAQADTSPLPLTAGPDKPSLFDAKGRVLGAPGGVQGAGGKWGGRRGGRKMLAGRMRGLASVIDEGLEWLRKHQDADGGWNAAAFMRHDRFGKKCDAPGEGIGRVGITGFCLLAFLGDGHTLAGGDDAEVVRRGVEFLRRQQDQGGALAKSLFEHAVATYAMCEAAGLSRSTVLGKEVSAALRYLVGKQSKDGGFHHAGASDRSDAWTTMHAILACKTGRDFRLFEGAESFERMGAWLDRKGELDKRAASRGDAPLAHGDRVREIRAAAKLFSSFILGRNPKRHSSMVDHADAIAKYRPDAEQADFDLCFIYVATYGLYQMGGAYWARWGRSMGHSLVDSRRQERNFMGSFDPMTPGTLLGGRVYATALAVLTAESFYRYTRLWR